MSAPNIVPRPVLDRMGYTNPSITRDWKKIFSKKPPKKAEPKPAVKTTVKPLRKAKGKKNEAKPETAPLVLNRHESPADFEKIAFVLKARSKDVNRAYLAVLHIEETQTGSRLIATDGKRLHVAEISRKIKGGDYKPALTKDSVSFGNPVEDITFPNWARVIPGNTRKRGSIDLTDTGMGKGRDQTERLSRVFHSFVKQTGELVNMRHLEDLSKKKWSVYCQNEKGGAIVLKEDGAAGSVFAVIMPLPETDVGKEAA
ncbi:hypothetical protein TREPR_0888 [Treponema primitia ZAS-2]|uniref:Uncharacterized protein n=1 Tax=Treponema primitia (strain ATCC BAA-887 / DSM 12427 / ZAS-2) TaxID=545694 RepID=F5YIK9_TREPZ|nr:hypothetical protein [Treponema primitia]AEF84825.1 hypothetical protein TREPR_0888 [Treponema primitia ZAS-2]